VCCNNHNIEKEKNKVLKDVNKKGNEVDWENKYERKEGMKEVYKELVNDGYDFMVSKSIRIGECGSYLTFGILEDNTKKLLEANFCKIRLCPMCSWRRSLKIFGQVSSIMNYLEENEDYRYLFLTLTCKNVKGSELDETIDLLMSAFAKLRKRKVFERAIKGWFRALEVTHDVNEFITRDMYYGNKNKHMKSKKKYYDDRGLKVGDKNFNFDLYHPHFHVILAVNKSYFDDNRLYIKQEEWTSLWKSCLKVDYTPIVDIRKLENKRKNHKSLASAIAETAKYTVKDDDYVIKDADGNIDMDMSKEAVLTLDIALAHRRLVAFGGVFKEVHDLLKLDDAVDGDLVVTDNDILREDIFTAIESYGWNIGVGNYILKKTQTPEDYFYLKANLLKISF